jgi:hypothetical protein
VEEAEARATRRGFPRISVGIDGELRVDATRPTRIVQCCDDRHRRPRTHEADNSAIDISPPAIEADGRIHSDALKKAWHPVRMNPHLPRGERVPAVLGNSRDHLEP